MAQFQISLEKKSVPKKYQPHYKKWLRFYWEFCEKYHHALPKPESLRPFIEKLRHKKQGDYQIKLKQAIGFLDKKDKVKINMFFRGREMAHKDLGRNILERIIKDVAGHGVPEKPPSMEGRVMYILLNPAASKT